MDLYTINHHDFYRSIEKMVEQERIALEKELVFNGLITEKNKAKRKLVFSYECLGGENMRLHWYLLVNGHIANLYKTFDFYCIAVR